MLQQSEELTHIGMSKVARYKWSVVDAPGRFMLIPKNRLKVASEDYQRKHNDPRSLALARSWSWAACGALGVASRDGEFWVFDGQHRFFGACKRTDINQLPCMVFETRDIVSEAEAFLATNTMRRPMTSVEKFKAQIIAGDPIAVYVNKLLEIEGIVASDTGRTQSARCITTLRQHATHNREALTRIWPLIVKVSEGEPIPAKIVDGLITIEINLPDDISLSQPIWRKRVLAAGCKRLLAEAASASAYHASAGGKIWAEGMLKAINHGQRVNLLKLKQK